MQQPAMTPRSQSQRSRLTTPQTLFPQSSRSTMETDLVTLLTRCALTFSHLLSSLLLTFSRLFSCSMEPFAKRFKLANLPQLASLPTCPNLQLPTCQGRTLCSTASCSAHHHRHLPSRHLFSSRPGAAQQSGMRDSSVEDSIMYLAR